MAKVSAQSLGAVICQDPPFLINRRDNFFIHFSEIRRYLSLNYFHIYSGIDMARNSYGKQEKFISKITFFFKGRGKKSLTNHKSLKGQ